MPDLVVSILVFGALSLIAGVAHFAARSRLPRRSSLAPRDIVGNRLIFGFEESEIAPLAERLEEAGIPLDVESSLHVQGHWRIGRQFVVPDDRFDEAILLLIDELGMEESARSLEVACPSCGGSTGSDAASCPDCGLGLAPSGSSVYRDQPFRAFLVEIGRFVP